MLSDTFPLLISSIDMLPRIFTCGNLIRDSQLQLLRQLIDQYRSSAAKPNPADAPSALGARGEDM